MADTLASYGDSESWFLHDAEAEALVTGDRDTTPVPAPLGRRLDELERQSTFIYGWPTLVAMNRQRKPMIAPLFAVTVRVERQGDEWIGHAESEPEFNLSVVAGDLFDLSMKDEVEAVVGEGLPFGDGTALVRVARAISRVLGVKVVSDLDPHSLDGRCEGTPGIRNAAVWVAASDGRNVYGSLLDELEKLAHRKDWTKTAAACLVPDRRTSGRAVHPNQNEQIAAPLPCNDSQELTLERFRHEPLTVVTGPPGTGKTQLVVNAVTNAWLDGETALVASTNNGAVDVAVERANDIWPGMLLRTGRRQEREALAGRAAEAVAAAAEDKAPDDGLDGVAREARARAALAKAAERRARLYADLSEAASLNGKLLENVEELEKHARVIWKRIRAPNLDIDSERIERQAKRIQRAWFFRGWRKRRLLRSVRCGNRGVPLDILARWAAVDQGRTTLLDELSSMEKRIGDADTNIRRIGEEWSEASKVAAIETVSAGFRRAKGALQALDRVNPGGTAFRKALRNCVRRARGWACTALSMQRSFPLEPGIFELSIIDEASQCNLAVALPLAYRAKRLAVIGDPSQLTPIVTLQRGRMRAIAASEGLDDDVLADNGIHFQEGSAYRAFEHALERENGQSVVLDEHYRCHPYIARWFNREFYRGALTVLTDTTGMPSDERSIGWIDIPGEALKGASGSWTNTAEAEATVQLLAERVHGTGGSIGVVTPFTAQALLIRDLAQRHPQLGDEALTEADFECGTAHRFQGAERDTVIFSAVLAPGISGRTAAWVEQERNLVNVAVSRARRSLVVLGHPRIGTKISPTLASLRSYLVETSTCEGGEQPVSAKFRTDSESEARLLRAMRNAGLSPSAKLFVQGYELDFALLEPETRLNVEVDGSHHTDARGKLRRQDLVRDRILAGHGWQVIRIPAWRCLWDADAAAQEVRLKLDEATERARQTAAQ